MRNLLLAGQGGAAGSAPLRRPPYALMAGGVVEPDAAQAAPRQLAREAVQKVSASEGADIHAQDLAPSVAVDADRNDHRD
jgi:hypothetical protein